MKKLFKIMFALIILGFSSQSNAQYIALKGGLNLSNMTNNGEDKNYKNRAGYHGGVIGGMRIGFFGVEGGLLISSKGYNYEYTEEVNNETYERIGNTNLVYLDVPINLKLSAGLGGTRVFATVGPVFGFGITGKSTEEIIINGAEPVTTEEKIKWGNSAEDHLQTTDIGLGFGAGIEIGNMTFSGTYNLGLTNIAANKDMGDEIKNKALQFSIAFRIFDL